ncbi:MAG: HEPN domain-containing protein [Candidatus Eremiobacteraeota bacterium]|nr:HEPN domain-containing protein [Candidatus Eremiobacteraeota bacterium]
MRRDRRAVASTWYRTAERDLRVARAALDIEPSLAAFHAQQAAEKALKAALVLATDDHPRTHTAGRLVRDLRDVDPQIGAEVERDATALDLYYLTSRYPDAVGDEDPGAVIVREDAEIALARAQRILEFVRHRIASPDVLPKRD